MTDDSLDRIIRNAYKTDSHKIEDINSIQIPSVNKSMEKLLKETNLHENSRFLIKQKLASNLMKNLATVAGFTLLILIGSLLLSVFSTTEKVRAVKFNIFKMLVEIKDDSSNITLKNSDSLDNTKSGEVNDPSKPSTNKDVIVQKLTLGEIYQKVKYPVLTPNYLPAGYKFKEATRYVYSDSKEVLEQKYISDVTEFIISQTTNETNVNSKIITQNKSDTKTIKVMNEEGALISYDENSHWLIWYNGDSRYEIIARFSESEFKKIIDSLSLVKQ